MRYFTLLNLALPLVAAYPLDEAAPSYGNDKKLAPPAVPVNGSIWNASPVAGKKPGYGEPQSTVKVAGTGVPKRPCPSGKTSKAQGPVAAPSEAPKPETPKPAEKQPAVNDTTKPKRPCNKKPQGATGAALPPPAPVKPVEPQSAPSSKPSAPKRPCTLSRRPATSPTASPAPVAPVIPAVPQPQVPKAAAETPASKPAPQPAPKPAPQPAPKPQPAPAPQPQPESGSGSGGSTPGPVPDSARAGFAKSNELRARHQVAPLTWDAELEKDAQAWANNCQFDHGGYDNESGQNLFVTSRQYPAGKDFLMEATNSWYSEESVYSRDTSYGEPQSFRPSGSSGQWGHFTQMVWKGTTKLGCAAQNCPSLGTFVVCNYKTGGNVARQYKQNVFPPSA
ncbi:hypothetical protein HIM_05114 [Hirsutella minnesotensis 3608]|uniref:SCP domain-containing protein n=1 Tax=Hirsutella minnesotensis 3608 TaxID=1043627 RepID=A0A0F7ZUT4_9HYPO|nr:hypothetical protein HIM_05114 [Hirsutella minnesotensis 3608]